MMLRMMMVGTMWVQAMSRNPDIPPGGSRAGPNVRQEIQTSPHSGEATTMMMMRSREAGGGGGGKVL